jgi:hypothetical protein
MQIHATQKILAVRQPTLQGLLVDAGMMGDKSLSRRDRSLPSRGVGRDPGLTRAMFDRVWRKMRELAYP